MTNAVSQPRYQLQFQPIFLVDVNLWSILMVNATLSMMIGVVYFNGIAYGTTLVTLGFLATLILWLQDVPTQGAHLGDHPITDRKELTMGVLLFIVTGIFFFVGTFWETFLSSVVTDVTMSFMVTGALLSQNTSKPEDKTSEDNTEAFADYKDKNGDTFELGLGVTEAQIKLLNHQELKNLVETKVAEFEEMQKIFAPGFKREGVTDPILVKLDEQHGTYTYHYVHEGETGDLLQRKLEQGEVGKDLTEDDLRYKYNKGLVTIQPGGSTAFFPLKDINSLRNSFAVKGLNVILASTISPGLTLGSTLVTICTVTKPFLPMNWPFDEVRNVSYRNGPFIQTLKLTYFSRRVADTVIFRHRVISSVSSKLNASISSQ